MGFDLTRVWGEDLTLDVVAAGRSISRYGEGELRYAVKGFAIKSQAHDPRLAVELINGLKNPGDCLIALPRLWKGMPSERFWRQFEHKAYTKHFCQAHYGSAFISRSDMVHEIDNEDYWAKVRNLWRDKDVTLVGQSPKILPMPEAKSVRYVAAPAVNAFVDISKVEEEIGTPSGPVMLCVGATATALVIRLTRKGVWALDMGHMGRFLASAGCYNLKTDSLISKGYLAMQKGLHASPQGYGGSGRKQAANVLAFIKEAKVPRILDYGCGRGSLKAALRMMGCEIDIMEYDPAVDGRGTLPKPAELVVCTDVLEHIEPDKLDAVLLHIRNLSKKAAYFVVATRPADRLLPDGRNTHLILKPPAWWVAKIENSGFKVQRTEIVPDHDVKIWCMI